MREATIKIVLQHQPGLTEIQGPSGDAANPGAGIANFTKRFNDVRGRLALSAAGITFVRLFSETNVGRNRGDCRFIG